MEDDEEELEDEELEDELEEEQQDTTLRLFQETTVALCLYPATAVLTLVRILLISEDLIGCSSDMLDREGREFAT